MSDLLSDIQDSLDNIQNHLVFEYNPKGFWGGHLSSSALATATAVFALHMHDPDEHEPQIKRGLNWLSDDANPDGGWGDTPRSQSNISTTMLCWSAFHSATDSDRHTGVLQHVQGYVRDVAGSLRTRDIASTIDDKYEHDKTFSVPILTMCTLAGLPSGNQPELWRFIKPLPYELAVMPRFLFRWLPLSVVSYALPALISMGIVHFERHGRTNPLSHIMRSITQRKAMNVLDEIQPEHGGFLEAVPLTSFVTMSLIGAGREESRVVERGIDFILQSLRDDGSWAIDTNLSTWLTSTTVNALDSPSGFDEWFGAENRRTTLQWLVNQQHTERHPYTGAAPGGWAWTDLPGGVPDADDTAGALIALYNLADDPEEYASSARMGLQWLMDLQNSDGGIPTFCKGWTDMPFDRSGPDLTAHAVQAIRAWHDAVGSDMQNKLDASLQTALDYLRRSQQDDGSWIPLWFGSEQHPHLHNPLYGTTRVVAAIRNIDSMQAQADKAIGWIMNNQNADAGWGAFKGAESSIEETALAVDALSQVLSADARVPRKPKPVLDMAREGARWLTRRTGHGQEMTPSPIGLYFAQLWYSERLYPPLFTASALLHLRNHIAPRSS